MLKKMLGPVAIILEVVEAIGRVDSELVEMSKSLQMSKGEAQQLRGGYVCICNSI